MSTKPTTRRRRQHAGRVRSPERGTPRDAFALRLAVLFLLFAFCLLPFSTFAAEPAEGGLLQKGLYEEEANHDLKSAIAAYQALVTQFDGQRPAVATAIFRLGECYRKQGRTNEAAAFYQRILRDFTDQTELARLSRMFAPAQLAAKLSAGESEENKRKRAEIQSRINNFQEELNSFDARIELANAQLATASKEYFEARKLLDEASSYPAYALPIQTDDPQFLRLKRDYSVYATNPGESDDQKKNIASLKQQTLDALKRWIDELHIPKIRATLELAERRLREAQKYLETLRAERKHFQNQLAAEQTKLLELSSFVDGGGNSQTLSPASQQRKELIEEEIRLVEQQLQAERRKVESGAAPSDNLIKFQREILALKREMLSSEKTQLDILDIPVPAKTNLVASANQSPSATEPAPDATAPATQDEAKELQRIKAMIKDSPDLVNAPDRGYTPLQRAANAGQLAVAEFLLAHNADVNGTSVNQPGSTPLHFAAWSGHKTMAELLIAHGADVNAFGPVADMTQLGRPVVKTTPLHVAIERGHKLLTQILLTNKATVDARAIVAGQQVSFEWAGATPLFYAAMNGRKDLAQMLLAAGADVNARNDFGRTPLFQAAWSDQYGMALWLLEHNADVNIQDSAGETALHIAVDWTRKEIVKLLLEHGAKANMNDAGGRTPLDRARNSPNPSTPAREEIIRLLSKPAQ